MDQIKQPSGDSNLHWFWKLATQWWFFPVFYVALVLLLFLLHASLDKELKLANFLQFLFLMPAGLIPLLGIDTPERSYSKVLSYVVLLFHLVVIPSMITIQYFKLKNKMVPKWLIIIPLLLIIMSFIGCAGFITGYIKS